MSAAELALRNALHASARTHLGAMFGIAANAPKPALSIPAKPIVPAMPVKG